MSLLYTEKNEFIIWGEININYLDSHNRRQQLDTLLAMYNLKSTVNFPMRIFNGSSTVIDNICICIYLFPKIPYTGMYPMDVGIVNKLAH